MSLQNFKVKQGIAIQDATATVEWLTGSGTPEGAKTAGVGSIYSDYTSGLFYKKVTGAGNTGWAELSSAAAVEAFDWKNSVLAASLATDGTLADGNFPLGNTLALTIDGQAFVNGGRYLIKNQTLPEENGIYTWATGGALTRALDANDVTKLTLGAAVTVDHGTQAGSLWMISTAPATIDVSPVVFTQFGVYTAGNGITISSGSVSAQLDAAGGLEFNGTATRINVDATNGTTAINGSNELVVSGRAVKTLAATTTGPDTLDSVAIASISAVEWFITIKNGTTGRYSSKVSAVNMGTGTTVDFTEYAVLSIGTITAPVLNVTSDSTNMILDVTTDAGYVVEVIRNSNI